MVNVLEQRTLLSAVSWDGGGGDFNWNNALNWNTNTLPGPADDVTIDFGANEFSVSISGNDHSVSSLTSYAGLNLTGQLSINSASNTESQIAGLLSIGNGGKLQTDESLTIGGLLRLADTYGDVPATIQGIGPGVQIVASGGVYFQSLVAIDNLNFVNTRDAVWRDGTVKFFGDSTFTNTVGATFDDQADGTFGSFDGNCIQFLNEGLFIKSGGTGITYLQMQLYNRGTVEIQQGQLYLGCGYVSNNPSNPPAPGITYPDDHPPEYRNDDPIVIDPGSPPVIVPGSYTQTVNGLLIEQIAGHSGSGVYGTPGIDYGQLVVNGDVALNGSFQVQVLSPFVPSLGQQFLVIDNRGSNPIDGTFIDLPEGAVVWAGNYGFTISYVGGTGNDVVLTALAPPRYFTLSGLVFLDLNNDGQVQYGETAISGVRIDLRNEAGTVISTTYTNSQGIYEFTGLSAGRYTITESQPAGYAQGINSVGTLGGSISAVDQFFVELSIAGGQFDGLNYNFAERPTATSVQPGQTASIGFWQNKNGQALIKALNGSSQSTQLANWLATTFPNMYGAAAGVNNLTGKTNTQVAAFYVSLFSRNGQTAPAGPPKTDAQVLATALAVYVTNSSLAGNVAAAYGFKVSANGVGAATFNVTTNGAAFGVANGSSVTVMNLLLAVNARTRRGLLFDLDDSGTISNSEKAFREMANTVFSGINESGDL